MSKKYLIITSIFPPTKAVKKFAELSDWNIVVVGDKKTPPDWAYENVTYLSPDDQEKLNFQTLKLLPWNHYCRKLAGYLYAIQQGAELIADSDDDNEPLANWPALPEATASLKTLSEEKFVNIYQYYTDKFVWPRGYPLDRILSRATPVETTSRADVAIWQGLANEDPDVDAIYRLTNNTLITFDEKPHVTLADGTVCPFNSQNTVFMKRDVFPLLYLPAFVTFRFTDILRGLVAQPILWKQNYQLGFGPATVVQERNPHDYLRDFESEIPVYLHSEKVIDIAVETLRAQSAESVSAQLLAVYKALLAEEIVTEAEVELLTAWCEDLSTLLES